MSTPEHIQPYSARENPFHGDDVLALLREHQWLQVEPSAKHIVFCEHAAALLGQFAENRIGLAHLLRLVFTYDAAEVMRSTEAHAVLSRYAARDVVRHLALLVLDGGPFTSDRFKDVVTHLKETLEVRGRDLFHPIRLALAGRAGDGELDRVILLVDEAAALPFVVPVKNVSARILEFCAALE